MLILKNLNKCRVLLIKNLIKKMKKRNKKKVRVGHATNLTISKWWHGFTDKSRDACLVLACILYGEMLKILLVHN
jgi:hypothetical protein